MYRAEHLSWGWRQQVLWHITTVLRTYITSPKNIILILYIGEPSPPYVALNIMLQKQWHDSQQHVYCYKECLKLHWIVEIFCLCLMLPNGKKAFIFCWGIKYISLYTFTGSVYSCNINWNSLLSSEYVEANFSLTSCNVKYLKSSLS